VEGGATIGTAEQAERPLARPTAQQPHTITARPAGLAGDRLVKPASCSCGCGSEDSPATGAGRTVCAGSG
jgi:hypothetical protein